MYKDAARSTYTPRHQYPNTSSTYRRQHGKSREIIISNSSQTQFTRNAYREYATGVKRSYKNSINRVARPPHIWWNCAIAAKISHSTMGGSRKARGLRKLENCKAHKMHKPACTQHISAKDTTRARNVHRMIIYVSKAQLANWDTNQTPHRHHSMCAMCPTVRKNCVLRRCWCARAPRGGSRASKRRLSCNKPIHMLMACHNTPHIHRNGAHGDTFIL